MAIEDSLHNKLAVWQHYAEQGNFKALQPARKNLESYIDLQLAGIKNMKHNGSTSELYDMVTYHLESMKKAATNVMAPFETVSAATTNDEIGRLSDKIISLNKQEERIKYKILLLKGQKNKATI